MTHVLVDLKHGFSLFFGTEAEMKMRYDSLEKRCKGIAETDFKKYLRIIETTDVAKDELLWMEEKRRLPRRVQMRFAAKHAGIQPEALTPSPLSL